MTDSEKRGLLIGVNVLGLGQRPAAWQSPGLDGLSLFDVDYWSNVARVAERGALDAIFLADSPALGANPNSRPGGALEPITLYGAVAAATSAVGLIATASTTFNDPFELAERLLTLDHLSGGRAGWNAVTTRGVQNANAFGLDDVPQRDVRYERAHEFVRLVEALWASAETGETVRHHGDFLELEGRLRVPPSAQGAPAVIQAGGSPRGRQLAGERAHGVFTADLTIEDAIRHYDETKGYAIAAGRNPDDVNLLPGFALVIGSTEEEAARRYDELEERAPGTYTEDRLSGILGIDVTTLDYDAQLPDEVTAVPDDPVAFTSSLSFRETTVRFARENRLTVRELLRSYGGYGHPIIIGTPERIADTFEEWFRRGAADGINIMPDVFPEGLEQFVDQVVPLLRAKGIFRHDYEDTTLRGRFAARGARRPR